MLKQLLKVSATITWSLKIVSFSTKWIAFLWEILSQKSNLAVFQTVHYQLLTQMILILSRIILFSPTQEINTVISLFTICNFSVGIFSFRRLLRNLDRVMVALLRSLVMNCPWILCICMMICINANKLKNLQSPSTSCYKYQRIIVSIKHFFFIGACICKTY